MGDESGSIDRTELAAALASLEMEPMAQVLAEIIDEVRGEDEQDQDIDLKQFKHLMHLLRLREGFSKQEYARMMLAFSVFDRDGSNSLDVRELTAVNAYLYYSL